MMAGCGICYRTPAVLVLGIQDFAVDEGIAGVDDVRVVVEGRALPHVDRVVAAAAGDGVI
jgi:hypothetical protein